MVDRWDSGPTFGIITDVAPYDLPPGAWSLAYNVSFKNSRTSQRGGLSEALYAYSYVLQDVTPNNTGTGTVTDIVTYPTSVTEVITLTCTAAAANSGTFSVSGSMSGALGTATVGTTFTSAVIRFTITDGGVDYQVGDNFIITVTKQAATETAKFLI